MDFELPEPALPAHRTYGGNGAFHNFHNDYAHIRDVNLRRRLALSELEQLPFSSYHVRAVVVAGIGFFTDSYDIFAISSITSMLGMVFWQGPPSMGGHNGTLPTSVNTAFKAATSGGAVLGQLGFGYLADVIGRRKMYGVELAIIILATLAQSLSAPSGAVTFTGLFIFWRVIMGIGIGGDYPLSAVITSEFAPTRWRGAMMAAVFSMQGAGQIAAALVALITTVAFKDAFLHSTSSFSSCDDRCQLAGDRAWRIIVGFGAVPACFALYYRITIPETPRYTFDVAQDVEKADADIKAFMNNQKDGIVDPIVQQQTKQRMGKQLATPQASWPDVFSYFSKWKNAKILLGTTSAWFFLDLAYYGLGLNSSTVLSAIGYSTGDTIYHTLMHSAIGNLILVCAGAMPGYWLSVGLIDTIGRKPIQIFGFFFLTIIFCTIGFAYNQLSEGALLTLYVLAQLFFNFGPNTTTFIVPGECFPTRYRSTGHGLSAACGKIGAIVAQVIAPPLLAKDPVKGCTGACSPWLKHLMQIFALFMLCGTMVSFLVPETKGRTLEELAGEAPSSPDMRSASDTPPRKGWLQRHNPFAGGKPAGFFWSKSPNLGPRSPGLRGKRQRLGIMASPELLLQKEAGEKTAATSGTRGRHSRMNSDTSINGTTNPASVTSHNHHGGKRKHSAPVAEEDDDDRYLHAALSGPVPMWGAGWGVQRNGDGMDGGRVVRMQSIKLQDVGRLLK